MIKYFLNLLLCQIFLPDVKRSDVSNKCMVFVTSLTTRTLYILSKIQFIKVEFFALCLVTIAMLSVVKAIKIRLYYQFNNLINVIDLILTPPYIILKQTMQVPNAALLYYSMFRHKNVLLTQTQVTIDNICELIIHTLEVSLLYSSFSVGLTYYYQSL